VGQPYFSNRLWAYLRERTAYEKTEALTSTTTSNLKELHQYQCNGFYKRPLRVLQPPPIRIDRGGRGVVYTTLKELFLKEQRASRKQTNKQTNKQNKQNKQTNRQTNKQINR